MNYNLGNAAMKEYRYCLEKAHATYASGRTLDFNQLFGTHLGFFARYLRQEIIAGREQRFLMANPDNKCRHGFIVR